MFKRTVSIALVIALVLSSFIYFAYWSFESSISFGSVGGMVSEIDTPQDDTSFGGIFFTPNIDETLPYHKYKIIEDSLKRIQDRIKITNERPFGNGRTLGSLGIKEIKKEMLSSLNLFEEKDPLYRALSDSVNMLMENIRSAEGTTRDSMRSALNGTEQRRFVRGNQLSQQHEDQKEKLYYLELSHYELNDDESYSTKFFVDGDSYYLAYVVWGATRKGTFDSVRSGRYERKQIPVRYAAEEKKILIPITNKQHQVIKTALLSVSYIGIFLSFYFLFGLPIQILINISRGKAFTLKNIRGLKLMALALGVYAIIATCGSYILEWFFRNTIPNEFHLPSFGRTLFEGLYLYMIALAIFIIALAFQRGYKLQQENSLTI